MTTNVVSTFLLAILMLPKMRETAQRYNTTPRLTVVSSDLHFIARFPEKDAVNTFDALNNRETADINARYFHFPFRTLEDYLTPLYYRYGVTKLLEILLIRHLAALATTLDDRNSETQTPKVIFNTLTPGACHSDFFREEGPLVQRIGIAVLFALTARRSDVGARTLVAAAVGGEETNGYCK